MAGLKLLQWLGGELAIAYGPQNIKKQLGQGTMISAYAKDGGYIVKKKKKVVKKRKK